MEEEDVKVTRMDTLIHGSDRGNFIIVKIETDEGIIGYGDASLENGTSSVVGALNDLQLAIVGENPLRIEKLWQDMYRAFQMIRGGVVYMTAISGIDQALWDIKGKALGVPVYELLGGALRERVPAFYYGLPQGASREETQEHALKMVAEGWRAFHGDPFGTANVSLAGDLPELARTMAYLETIREAVGDRVDLAIDCHGRFTPAGALRVARMLEPLHPVWFEEPIPPENTEALADVARSCAIPIASGERLYTRWGYRELFDRGAAAIIQPDVCHVGGITELRKVASMAEVYHIVVAPHMIYSPLALAATLQVDASMSNLIMQGVYGSMIPLQDDMFKQRVIEVRDGWFNVPTGPGLGVDIDEEKIAHHPYRPLTARSLGSPGLGGQWHRKMAP
jgi:galactonate dehydratase